MLSANFQSNGIKMVKKHYTLFKVFYIGDMYHGSQRQPELHTIEGKLLNALYKKAYIDDEDYKKQVIHSAGRTDAGVHARGMTYGFFNQRKKFHPIEVNTALPEDIIIWGVTNSELKDNIPLIHPRYQATQRHYKYFIVDSNGILNQEIMQDCVKTLSGTHDFRNFSKNEEKTDTNRTVDEINIENYGDLWVFNFHARSFLWHQIRNMMRVMIQIGSQKWEMSILSSLLDPSDKKFALKIEPMLPNGLILWDVFYPEITFEKCAASYAKLIRVLNKWLYDLNIRTKILDSVKSSFE